MTSLFQDLKFGLRTMIKYWPTSLAILLSLTLAIGGNGAVFSLVDAFLFSQIPYKDVDQMVILWYQQQGETQSQFTLSLAELREHRRRSTQLSELAAFRSLLLNMRGSERSEQILGSAVTPNIFQFLGFHPQVGRLFSSDDGKPGNGKVVILDYRFWQQRFRGSPSAIGQTLDLDGQRYSIVGVMPEDFELFLPGIQLYVPLILDREDLPRQVRDTLALGHLAPGATLEQAQQEASRLAADLQSRFPDSNRDTQAKLDFLENRFPDPRNIALMALLQGAVLFVLLIACANISNVLLARGISRRTEIAMRSALGASRFRVIRQLLSESLTLSLIGGFLGVGLASVVIRMVSASFSSMLPRMYQPRLDFRVLLFMVLVSGCAGLLFGLMPALQTLRVGLVEALQGAGRSGRGAARQRLSRVLVVGEVALATVLLGGAAVLISSLGEFRSIDPALEADTLLSTTLSLPRDRFDTAASIETFSEGLRQHVEERPEVRIAALASSLPRSPFYATTTYSPGSQSPVEQTGLPTAIWVGISPQYLDAFNLALRAGRNFDSSDTSTSLATALVSEGLASSLWGGSEAVGQSIYALGKTRRVVGVVEEVTQEFLLDAAGSKPVIYIPLSQSGLRSITLVARSRGNVAASSQALRKAIEEYDRDVSVGQILTVQDFIQQFFVGVDFMSAILAAFGIVALVLAALGVFSVLSFLVSQRTQEIGIRIALGANRGRVLRLFLRQALVMLLFGFLVGVPGAILVSRVITSALAGIVPVQVGMMIPVALVLVAVSLLAAYLPARRAATLDPAISLRKI